MSKKRKLHQIKIVVPHSSIRLQLITGFLVPIIFIIIIGVVSYQKSYEGLIQNYEKSALTAIDMTADSRMISVNNPVDSGLIDTAESSSYVKVDGRRYYYMSAESSVTGGKIVVMVPIEYITAGTKDIRDITIAMIVEACIAAMLIATVITAGITRNIRKSIGRLDRVANGDLTVQEKEKRKKGGEFGKLSEALFHTITRMRSLIMTVAEMKNEVLQSGECVMETSGKVNEMVESAGYTMEAFGNMSSVMESMIQELDEISGKVDEMNGRRHAVLDKIRAIGDSSEHTVRTTEEINRFLGQQMEDSEALKSEVVKMMDSMKQLENAIETFRLN